MKCKALEIRWHETKPIFSADLHSVPPTQHTKPAHPYAKLGATGVEPLAAEDDHARKERLKREDDSKDRDKSWRLATCGGDNNVRLWLVTPRPHPDAPALSLFAKKPAPAAAPAPSASSSSAQHASKSAPEPKVEYLATLSQHTGVVNCVRFAPFGEMLASAGDDGNILIWVPGESSKKMGETDEDRAYEKESWRVRSMIRSMSGKEIYDLAWSPSGDRLLAGSVDHTATIYDVLSGAPLYKIAEHTNYVQGVCWDPRGELIATQSSDRSMHVYEVRDAKKGGAGGVEVHAVGKNSRLEVQRRPLSASSSSAGPSASASSGSLKRARKPSEAAADLLTPSSSAGAESGRPGMPARASSTRSDVSDRSTATTVATTAGATEVTKPMDPPTGIPHHPPPPPPRAHSHSRRSSTSGSQPSQSPRLTPVAVPSGGGSGSLSMRSPSPAPPLPAVMLPLSPKISPAPGPAGGGDDEPSSSSAGSRSQQQQQTQSQPVQTQTIKLYGDANSTPFFRRLCWSTDGSLLLTPAGLWEDPYAAPASLSATSTSGSGASSSKPGKKDKKDDRAAPSTGAGAGSTEPRPTVYIYSRANVARPPVAHLPGHRTTSIAIRFCPVLFDLRSSSSSGSGSGAGAASASAGAGAGKGNGDGEGVEGEGEDEGVGRVELGSETKDVSLAGSSSSSTAADKGKARALDPDGDDKTKDKPQSMFDLPYRMVYAVATLDSVYLYDTQQAGPIAMFGNLHYAPFTDLTWSTDGQTLVISSQDGYCSVVAFEPGELGTLYADQRPWTSLAAAPAAVHGAGPPAAATAPASLAKVEHKPDAAGALPSLFAKVASSSSSTGTGSSAPSVVVDLTQSDSASSSPVKRPSSAAGAGSGASAKEGARDEDGPPPEKKQKKRVAPTLVRPLGS